MNYRDLNWLGSSLEDLRDFPADVRFDAGFELRRVQEDKEPTNWKPMSTIGQGVREIRIAADSGAYRVLYAVKIAGIVHVLHCFHKTTEQTSQRDIDRGKEMYRQLEAELRAARSIRKVSKATKGRRKKE